MALQIKPSQQLLLISSSTKQHFLFDPKTTAIISTFRDTHPMATKAVYFQPTKQFLMAQFDRSFVSIWDIDSQQATYTVSLSESIAFLQFQQQSGLLFGGSKNGLIYIWLMPTGILLKKFSAHNHAIANIYTVENSGKILTLSKKQAKIWSYFSLFVQNQDSTICQTSLHLPSQVIDSAIQRGLLFTLHKGSMCISSIESLTIKQIIQLQSNCIPTCFCMSRSSFYVGNGNGTINQYALSSDLFSDSNRGSFKGKTLDFVDGQLQINQLDRKRKKQTSLTLKNAVSSLAFIDSLGLLISGTDHGQVGVWENGKLRKSVQLYKSPILHMSVIKRPQNDGVKIPDSSKIKSLHKYEMTKEEEPLHIYQIYQNNNLQLQQIKVQLNEIGNQWDQSQQILDSMMKQLGQPYEIMRQQIQLLEKEKEILIMENQQFANILSRLK